MEESKDTTDYLSLLTQTNNSSWLSKLNYNRTTRHPGSKKPRNLKRRRATAKRAKESRRINQAFARKVRSK